MPAEKGGFFFFFKGKVMLFCYFSRVGVGSFVHRCEARGGRGSELLHCLGPREGGCGLVCNGTMIIPRLRAQLEGTGWWHLELWQRQQGRSRGAYPGGRCPAAGEGGRRLAGGRARARRARGRGRGGRRARAHLSWTAARAELRLTPALRAGKGGGRAGRRGRDAEGRRRRRRLGWLARLSLVLPPAG